VSPEQRTDRDTNSKTVAKLWYRKRKEKHCLKSNGPLPNGKEALTNKTLLKEKGKKKHLKGAHKHWFLYLRSIYKL
jgi:hypothetical protein